MLNKSLRKKLNLALDSMSMQGPIKVRDVAKEVLRTSPDEFWSMDVEQEARLAHLCHHVKQDMAVTLSAEYVEKHLPTVPDEYHAMFKGFPKYICINPRGGKDSEHVLTILATPEQWNANFTLKRRVREATEISEGKSRGFRDLLIANNANSLYELFGR